MAGQAALDGVLPRASRRAVTPRRERALVRAAQRGDAAALEALFRAHWPALYRAAWFVVRDEQAAEDIAQEAFLAAVAALDRFDRRRPLAPWLKTIVARRAIDALRSRNLRREVGDAPLEALPARAGAGALRRPRRRPRRAARRPADGRRPAPRPRADPGRDRRRPRRAARDRQLPAAPRPRRARAVGGGRDGEASCASIRAPGEAEAQQRAWRVAAAALPAAGRAPGAAAPQGAALVALAATLALLAAAVTPPGSAVADWVGDAVKSVVDDDPPPRAAHGLDDLPGGGRLLVVADGTVADRPGPQVVGADRATWSPRGLFVAAARGNELLAVDPEGELRWRLAAPATVERLAWSPDGFRIAYATPTQMRLVAGDGTGDRVVTQRVVRDGASAFGGIAWRPGTDEHVLAYTDRRHVWVVEHRPPHRALEREGARTAGTSRSPPTADGSSSSTTPGSACSAPRRAAPRGAPPRAASPTPRGCRTAAATSSSSGRRGQAEVIAKGPRTRRLFAAGALRLGGVSPDGRWLLVDWTETRTWLFVPLDGGRARQLTAVPKRYERRSVTPQGWCCAQRSKPRRCQAPPRSGDPAVPGTSPLLAASLTTSGDPPSLRV